MILFECTLYLKSTHTSFALDRCGTLKTNSTPINSSFLPRSTWATVNKRDGKRLQGGSSTEPLRVAGITCDRFATHIDGRYRKGRKGGRSSQAHRR